MLRRMFSPIPLLITILSTFGVLYFLKTEFPQFQVSQEIKLSFENKKISDVNELIDLKKSAPELKLLIEKYFQKLPSNANPVFKYFLENNYPSNFYQKNQTININTNKNEIQITINYPTKNQVQPSQITPLANALKQTSKTALTLQLKNEMKKTSALITSNQKKLKSFMQSPVKKNKKTPEIKIKKNDPTKLKPNLSKIPPEAISSLKKFKLYKDKKLVRLKEVQELLKNIPEPGQAKLKLLTSNLQKSYLLEENRLDLNIRFGPQKDKGKIKEYRSLKNNVIAKLKLENIRLRDESHYLKGQQDQALRSQKFTLLQEEKSLNDTLKALDELQIYIFNSDQQSNLSGQKKQTTNAESSGSKTSFTTNSNLKNNDSIGSIEKENEALNSRLIAIKTALSHLKTLSLKPTLKKPTIELVQIYKNWYLISHLCLFILILSFITGIIFGKKRNIIKGEEAAEILEMQLLGTIPNIPNNGLENAKQKRFTDAIDIITNEITTLIQTKDLKTIGVISPNENEGKTQLTGMISLSYNLNQKMKVVALDMMMEGTKIADFLRLKNKLLPTDDGIISYFKELNEQQEINEVKNNQWLAKLVKPCIKNGIFAISAGKGPFDNEAIVNEKSINTMYDGLGKYVDLILVNTPALQGDKKAIAQIISKNSDGNVLLIRKGKYSKKGLIELKEFMADIPVLGIVFK